MHQPPESTAAAAAAADISARKMAHPAMFPRRGSGSGSASALNAAGTGVGSNATSSEDFPPPSLLQPPPPAAASSTSGPQPPPPQSLNLLSQAQLQAQPLAPGGTQMKKKSGFQITSVTPAQISASISSNNSIAEDTESYDDLDESHTEDLSSSEILDVSLSRATDLGEPERSSSEETLNNFQEAETPGAVSPNQPHLPQPHLPHLPQQNVVINGNAHPHHLHHHHHIHHGHHLQHGHHPSHAAVATASIPGGPPSSPVSRKLSTTGSSDSITPVAPTSAVSSSGSPASMMTNMRTPSTTGGIGINSVTGTNTVNNVNITAVGSFSPNVTSSMPGNANISASNVPSAASVSVGPGITSGVNVNILSGMGNGTISSSTAVSSVPNAAAGMTGGLVSSQQQQPTVNTSRFRVVKLDSSSEPFKKGRWTCTEFYEKENAVPATEGVLINKVVETVKQNPIEVTSERESTSGSSVSSSVSTLSHYTESVGSGEMGAPTVVVQQQQQQQQQPALQGMTLQQMDFGSTGPQSISQSQISQVQLQSQELGYQQKQGLQPVPLQATMSAATGIQPSPVNVVGVTSALGQQPSISSLAQPQLPYSQAAPPVQTPLPGAPPPQQLQYGQQQPMVSTQMAPGHVKSVTQNPASEYVQQQPILQTAVSSTQPSSAGVGVGTTVIPVAQPQSIQLPVQPTAVPAQPAGASVQPVGQAQTAVSAVPTGSQIASIGQQASVPTAVQQPSTQVPPAVIQQGAPPSSQVVTSAQTGIIHQGVQTRAPSLPQQLVIAPQSNLLTTMPPQPQGVEPVAQGVVSQQLSAVSPLPSASSISVTSQVSSTGPSGMPSAPTNLVPPQNIAQTPATQNGNLVQSVSQPPLIATNINLPLAQQIPLSSTQFSAQSLAQAIGSHIEDARRPAEPSLVGLPQTISGDSGGMSAVSDGSSSSLAASASLFPLKVLPLTTPLVDGEDESSSGASVVAIDNKIEQAMDLVKSHLMYAVREEVEVLKEQIKELIEKNSQLEQENNLLKTLASPEQLAQFQAQLQTGSPPATTQPQGTTQPPAQPASQGSGPTA
ncbi:TSC22 domain family protein 1 isoform X1 [Cebus imitator]|uniref:TSC22 domain family protein 1 n=1 Tax=Cebus imitator TaxID=2715852 RepID=A0A2K5QKY7_CEBIM|nr:TSC22 domain family protein 1 isoform X1 [Cebus imitator]